MHGWLRWFFACGTSSWTRSSRTRIASSCASFEMQFRIAEQAPPRVQSVFAFAWIHRGSLILLELTAPVVEQKYCVGNRVVDLSGHSKQE